MSSFFETNLKTQLKKINMKINSSFNTLKAPSDFYVSTLFLLVINDRRIPEDLRGHFYELREKYEASIEDERDRLKWIKRDGFFKPMPN